MSLRRSATARGIRPVSAMLVVALLAAPLPAQQPRAPTEPPVRHDPDLLPPAFHQSRRDAVLRMLPPDAVALVLSAPERSREGDVAYEYRQSSDLYYLTGMHEPNAVLLLAPRGLEVDGDTIPEVLLVAPRDPRQEAWLGRRLGPEGAQRELGVARAVTLDHLEELLRQMAAAGRRLHHLPFPTGIAEGTSLAQQIAVVQARFAILPVKGGSAQEIVALQLLDTDSEDEYRRTQRILRRVGADTFFADAALRDIAEAYQAAGSLAAWHRWRTQHLDGRYADGHTLRRLLDDLRTVKTAAELALLQRAVDITAAAHREAMQSIEPGMYEYEVEALVEFVFRRNGAESPGFPSIVGSGDNALVLHYETNRRRMEAGDLVVMDIGAEYHGYTADVTRTVPVSGRFSPAQRAIYELVRRAQEAGIREARAGAPFNAPERAAYAVVTAGLRELGLLTEDQDAFRFVNHGASHYLGLMVHDVGRGGPLAAGTVITVEPGVYIRPAASVDPKWWNIGVRIEDDVLITAEGPVVMSAAAPRTVAEIEALMEQQGLGNDPAGIVPRPQR